MHTALTRPFVHLKYFLPASKNVAFLPASRSPLGTGTYVNIADG